MPQTFQNNRMGSAFPFLRLPEELRNEVYRLLLVDPVICNRNFSEHEEVTYFVLHPAVVFTSRHVYQEAREIFFSKTEFVVFNFRVADCPPLTKYLPVFLKLAKRDVITSLLNITIKPSDDHEIRESEWTTLITKSEGVMAILESIWCQHIWNSDFGDDLDLFLNFFSKSDARRSTLTSQVLLPWGHLQGFNKVILEGQIGEDVEQKLQNHMALGPPLETACSTMDELLTKADDYYCKKQYHLAKCHYSAGGNYQTFRSFWLSRTNQEEQKTDFLAATFLSNLRTELGTMKVNLRLRHDYDEVIWISAYLTDFLMKDSAEYDSNKDCRLNLLLWAKAAICQQMANLALSKHGNANDSLKTAHFRLQELSDSFEDGSSQKLYEELQWAGEHYLQELKTASIQSPIAKPSSTQNPSSSDLHSAFRSFWELLEIPEDKLTLGGKRKTDETDDEMD